jgi:hypothetical protein
MREGESGRVRETAGCAVYDFSDHGQGTNRACAYAWNQQKFSEICRPSTCSGGKITAQPSRDDIFGTNIVMDRHDKTRQYQLRRC